MSPPDEDRPKASGHTPDPEGGVDHAVGGWTSHGAGPPDDELPGRARRPADDGWDHAEAITTTPWDTPPTHLQETMDQDVVLDCGWGQLVFGQTFADQRTMASVLRQEVHGRRDICLYLRDPHVFVARHPHEFFIDPSYTYRLRFTPTDAEPPVAPGVVVRPIQGTDDAEAMDRIYVRCGMVPAPPDVLWRNHAETDHVLYLVAVRADTGEILGTVTGIDHERLFHDPERGSSLWCLAVDPDCSVPGVGRTLVGALAQVFRERGRSYMDLSVVHDNDAAIALYEKLGFARVPVYGVKRKNAINEPLFTSLPTETIEDLNPYARIIADEAIRRGIRVEVLDAEAGELRLTHGGRTVVTREALSEYTTAVAMSRCDDKRLTRRIVAEAGITVPQGRLATFDDDDAAFLEEVGDAVVKPVRGEQGLGITVGISGPDELARACARAREHCPDVLIEERAPGDDLRLVVIDGEVVAAAVRRPAEVVGTGEATIRDLMEAQSRRRQAATGGESSIPIDDVTIATIEEAGHGLDDVLAEGVRLRVRRTANLHTGGTIHDVTAEVHPDLRTVATTAARAIDIPVTGIDLLVPDVRAPEYVFIEANERPGLANHEPQPTAAAFVDFLFPGNRGLPRVWTPEGATDH
ncbi:N-acetylglutaminylglutamine synthetase [Iamia majanohamensis]|uniref:N-acetylglutaminylglutamine synthetase n=1 Tax=Iamia majanohamensis TaxID=467976 RepID=A0AAF0BR15_9ACTN|nr:N-acetylglutaminylglutamine synthetase [Iamia majanohamensis]WCO65781.1 N-acetylglutaminylglutamine synthetase [Iamia majanohamensis]